MQELLERLAAARIICFPYVVTCEDTATAPALSTPPGVTFRELTADDAAAIVAISVRTRRVQDVIDLLGTSRSFGAFLAGQLIAFTWTRTTMVPLVYGGGTLFALAADEAYLQDMFVDPRHRGLRVAPWLRVSVLRTLASEGRPRSFSLSYWFNRSSRVFKSRLGSIECEFRLALQLDVFGLPGIDVRLRRRGPRLRTAALRRRWTAKEAR